MPAIALRTKMVLVSPLMKSKLILACAIGCVCLALLFCTVALSTSHGIFKQATAEQRAELFEDFTRLSN